MSNGAYFTDRDVSTLTAMWKAGYSGSQIAEQLGRTRSAILGKVFRLGLRRSWRKNKNKNGHRKVFA